MPSQNASPQQSPPSDAPRPSAAQLAAMVEAAYILDACIRHLDAGIPRKVQRDGFPYDKVVFVIVTRKLCDREGTVLLAHGCLRTRAAEGRPRREQES